jgi:uncharacterized protein
MDEKPKYRRSFFRNASAILLGVISFLAVIMLFENRLIFLPSRYPDGEWDKIKNGFEDVWFESADGTKLHGWYLPNPNSRRHILYCHGNAGNLTWRADVVSQLHDQLDASVFLFDYRGYGRSKGRPNEQAVYEDAQAASDWLVNRAEVDPGELILVGRSIGGAIAIELASRRPPAALILQSTFTNLPELAAKLYPFLPVRWFIRSEFDSIKKIADYRGPLFQSHGADDSMIAPDMGQALFEAAGSDAKRFYIEKETGHNDSPDQDYYDQLGKFLESVGR